MNRKNINILNYSPQQNVTSKERHEFSLLNFTYTPLSGNIFIRQGPWRPFARSHEHPESYISCSCCVEGSSLNHLFSCSSSSRRCGLELSSTLSQHMSGQLNVSLRLPAAEATAGKHQRPETCLRQRTQTLSRNPLPYS